MKLRFTRPELQAIESALMEWGRFHGDDSHPRWTAVAKVRAEMAKDEAAVSLGSRKSARKAVSSAANGRKGGRPKKVKP